MRQFTAYKILRDSEVSCSRDKMAATELLCIAEVFEMAGDLVTNLEWMQPDEPTDDACQHEYTGGAFEIPVLIKRQYHRYTSGVKVSATIQQRY